MKTRLGIFAVIVTSATWGYGQGTFIFDQQSSTDETPWPYGAGAHIQQLSPYGQSFTPILPAVSFVRLNLNDNDPNNGLGATFSLNLRTNSTSGVILGTTPLVPLTNGFTGTVDFLFPSDVTLIPGSTYLFEIVVQAGSDAWNSAAGELNYPGGTAFGNGFPAAGSDVWFREGVVPEPSSAALLLLGAGAFALRGFGRRKRVHEYKFEA